MKYFINRKGTPYSPRGPRDFLCYLCQRITILYITGNNTAIHYFKGNLKQKWVPRICLIFFNFILTGYKTFLYRVGGSEEPPLKRYSTNPGQVRFPNTELNSSLFGYLTLYLKLPRQTAWKLWFCKSSRNLVQKLPITSSRVSGYCISTISYWSLLIPSITS